MIEAMDQGNFHWTKKAKVRDGVCHRCGWSGRVARIGRHQRKILKFDRAYSFLCADCVNDLLDQRVRDEGESILMQKQIKRLGHRDVA